MAMNTAEGSPVRVETSKKRVRAVFHGRTLADTLGVALLLERGHRPVYYFPREDVRAEMLSRTNHHTRCPYKGDASYWDLVAGGRRVENAVWSYEEPIAGMEAIKGRLAFYWDKIDHWFEEDEEIFGHPRDPYHRVDVRPSSRRVRVQLAGETVADTSRALFLFETGLPTRYYIPPQDTRMELLRETAHHTVCPYKGRASYWTLTVGGRVAENAAWGYPDPLADCPLIGGYLCFYPDRVDAIEVEGEG
jgi:uncharacterized protein (DUF427 family)